MRTGKELLIASKRYAGEDRAKSWWYLWSTLILMVSLMTLAALVPSLWIAIPISLIAGLVVVRMFIVYHDYMHGTILKGSKVAKAILYTYGLVSLNPPKAWKHSHDDHHQNNSKKLGAAMGSFPIMSTEDYEKASFWNRLGYQISRHPVTIILGYLTIFMGATCLFPFLQNPIKHRQNALAIVVHALCVVLIATVSWQALILGWLIPFFVASALGAYLFFAQHNFPGINRKHNEQWDYVHAALQSSSFMKMSWLMNWFTGNIGYHHVHHLNAKIPFYRLPEAMAGIKELQSPPVTTLHPSDIAACLNLNLWDKNRNRLVSYREAKELRQCV